MKKALYRIFHAITKDIWSLRWVFAAFLVWNVVIRAIFHAFCPFLITFGFPCAGCGLTRAILAICQGDFSRAMYRNPSAFLWLGWIVFFLYKRYIRQDKKGIVQTLFLVGGISFLIYLYRMIFFFPSEPPMTYYRKCILNQIIPGYFAFIQALFG